MKDKAVQQYSDVLTKLGIGHTIFEHPQLISVAAVQKFLGYGMEDSAATLVMKADDTFIAIIRRGDTKLDSEKVKKLLGVGTLRMATEEEFTRVTGVPSGAASVYIPHMPTYIDEKIFEKEYINAGSGSLLYTIRYKSDDLKKIPGIRILDVITLERTTPRPMQQQVINKRFLSGITPSGDGSLHIGNYLGMVKQSKEMARENECFLFIADLHALTTIQNKKQLAGNIETLILNELALLGDLKNIIFFRQSDVPEHTELQSILNNITPLGLLKRAHAYKDKLAKETAEEEINLGLFNYPILMAADILLYKPDLVPVGKDQKQHIEITRDIAGRFNKIFKKNVFKLPDAYIPEEVATILGTDGKRKMSKSLGNVISIFEPEEILKKQVMNTYTDPTRKHATDPGHIEGNMVFTYLDFFGDPPAGGGEVGKLKERYTKGQISDVEVKNYLFESLLKFFGPARKRYEELKANPEKVRQILTSGAERARSIAYQTMREVRETIGLVNSYSLNEKLKIKNVNLKNQNPSEQITIAEFAKVEVRVGKVEVAENVENSEKLIRLHVDFAAAGKRIIFTAVRGYGFTPQDFSGKQFMFVYNLQPKKIMNEESQGMILAVEGEGKLAFITAEGLPIGAKVS